jgi:hypothetical protein
MNRNVKITKLQNYKIGFHFPIFECFHFQMLHYG